MASLRDLRSRIKGVQNTQKITRAMKMVASAKLRRAQDAMLNARPYAEKIRAFMSHLAANLDVSDSLLLAERETKAELIVVVTADRGLAGGFNSNIVRETLRHIREDLEPNGVTPKLFCVGKKGRDQLRRENYEIVDEHVGLFADLRAADSNYVVARALDRYVADEVQRVTVVYNKFVSVGKQEPTLARFLPLETIEAEEEKASKIEYIYEPSKEDVLDFILPRFLDSQVWRALLESAAAEQAARMTAMDNATENAQEMIENLRRVYNTERQSQITTEILEIVSGANALKEG
jgi:F-type H+-transporting ATPase subunit gamma